MSAVARRLGRGRGSGGEEEGRGGEARFCFLCDSADVPLPEPERVAVTAWGVSEGSAFRSMALALRLLLRISPSRPLPLHSLPVWSDACCCSPSCEKNNQG